MNIMKRVSFLMAFVVLLSFTTNASGTVITVDDGESIGDAIANAASGDTIELVSGGIYDGFDLADKEITVVAEDDAIVMPMITSDIDISGSGTALEVDGIELDGHYENSYAFNFESDMDSVTYLKVKNSVIHRWENTFLRANRSEYRADTIMVDNSVIYELGDYDLIQGRGNLLTNYISFTNSTIYNNIESFVRVEQDSIPFDIVIDHVTFNNAVSYGDGDGIFLDLEGAPAGSKFVFTNSIIANFSNPSEQVELWEFSDALADTIRNVHFYNVNADTANGWDHMENFTMTDPQFENAEAGLFALPTGSALLTADSDGGAVGDQRWGSYDVAASKIAHWDFDDASGLTADESVNGFDGTLTNMLGNEWDVGVHGTALDFSAGTDSSVVLVESNDTLAVDSTQSFSISLLAKTDPINNTNAQGLLMKGSFGDPNSGDRYQMEFKDGEVRIAVDDDETKSQLGGELPADYPVNQWAHIVGVRDQGIPGLKNKSLKLYLNGEFLAAMPDLTTGPIQTDTDDPFALHIGNSINLDTPLDGLLDDVQMYDYALTPEKVTELYESYAFDPKTKVAYWKFDGAAGDSVITDELDMSDGGLINMDPDSSWTSDGVMGSAVNFDYAPDSGVVEIGDYAAVDFDSTDSFTLSAWVKTDPISYQEAQAIMIKGSFSENSDLGHFGSRYQMEMKDGELRVAVDHGPTDAKTQLGADITGGNFAAGKWNHVVGVRDQAQDSLKLYLNGEKIGAMKDITEGNISSDVPLVIGNRSPEVPGDDPFMGQIDEVAIYDYAMDEDEVKKTFNAYGMNPSAPLVHYKLNGSSGDTVATDASGNADAMLLNMDPAEVWAGTHMGNGINFHAATDSGVIQVEDNTAASFDSTNSFTISALVKTDPISDTEAQAVAIKGSFGDPESGKRYQMEFKDGQLRVAVDDDVTKSQLDGVLPMNYPVNEWVHIVGVRDMSEDSLKLYLNGQRLAAMFDATTGNIESVEPLTIGNTYFKDTKFRGWMDDVRVYDYALKANQVANLAETYKLSTVGVQDETEDGLPVAYELQQNYPNPFNPTTTIRFALPQAGQTTITVYNVMGQRVATLMNKKLEAGSYSVEFDGTGLASGMYFYRLRSGDFTKVNKMLLLK
ncbi:MAG: DUF4957 domain-containing protein [Candidatus Marinimicrobia bacterium]|nr:DUF4957 domain-containing protein [Candidatus Neomarinimicrobiota bacterium]MCF7827407.1 DUF4957 domain-containing protein [Candidatus Neomarinimicrobiota bacterium]MCF7881360.1 DUF4957 domain-containing protein [Candidatus Neomarinimicrobiota bacterium]